MRPGYAQTSVEEISRRARVTTGALYHHFESKQELMRAVFEEIESGLAERVARAAAGERDPQRQVLASIREFLGACLDPAVRRIAYEEAPAALGWELWKEIDERYGLRLVRGAVDVLERAGLIRRYDCDLLARVLLGALVEAGGAVGSSEDPEKALAEAERIVTDLLAGLRAQR